jgi:hypothetical protein
MSFKIPKIRKAFPFQRPLARQMNSIAELLNRGIVVDSLDIQGRRQQDGRVRLIGGGQALSLAAAVSGGGTPGPGSAGTFTEFYCQSGGSNLNAGSNANNAAAFTSTNGNWTSGTGVFIPTDGSTPASFVNVGDFASIFLDAATVGVFIGRVTAVAGGVNGAITVSLTVAAGTAPSTLATGRTIKVGGALKGPNGASGYPLSLANLARLKDVAGDTMRLNLKNDATYSISAQITQGALGGFFIVQGFSATPGDGGKAIISTGSNAITALSLSGDSCPFSDIEFSTTTTTGTQDLVSGPARRTPFYRCIFHGARGNGIIIGAAILFECEAYDCNKSNTAGSGGFSIQGENALLIRCYSHDHSAGSNASGVKIDTGAALVNCIIESCAGSGILMGVSTSMMVLKNTDFYNNTGNAINIGASAGNAFLIENCNFLKNFRAINNLATGVYGYAYNCGYGAGIMANLNADVLGLIIKQAAVIYPIDATPWSAADSGNFTAAGASIAAGRGVFTETAPSAGTVGAPNIGAA